MLLGSFFTWVYFLLEPFFYYAGAETANGPNNRIDLNIELELELIQAHMTQKPLLWVEVGAHAVRKRSECAGVVWAGAGVARRLCVCCL
jgi:hypothetical protein